MADDSLDPAIAIVERILKAGERIAMLPRNGHVLEELDRGDVREVSAYPSR